MTNGSNDRLNRIEDDLETVKDILLTVARRAESTEERLERQQIGFDRRMEQFLASAEADRVVMHEVIDQLASLHEDNQRILNYLFGQQRGNGHGEQTES